MRGESSLSVVNSLDFSVRHVHNFWKFGSGQAISFVVGLDSLGGKIVGLGIIGDFEDGLQTVHVYDGEEGVISFEVSEFDEKGIL